MNISFDNWLLIEEAVFFSEATRKPPTPWRIKTPHLGKNPKTTKSDSLEGGANTKNLDDALRKPDGTSYTDFDTYLIHFMPAAQSGFITCPCASGGCASECLNTAGNMGALGGKTISRLKRTWELAKEGPLVLRKIRKEIAGKLQKAEEKNKKLVIRLNGTSDFDWTKYTDPNGFNLFELFPTVQFYDYTKVANRMETLPKQHSNYHLTFSRNEKNENQQKSLELLYKGHNVAVVFGPGKTGGASELIFRKSVNQKTIDDLKSQGIIPRNYSYSGSRDGQALLPEKFDGFKVVDGDGHDLRFLEKTHTKKGVVVGLTAKGSSTFENFNLKTKKFETTSGFVVQPLDNGITKHRENYDFIVCAMDYINNRNIEESKGRRQFGISKLLYSKKQAVITYFIFDDIKPLKQVAEKWALIQNPPVILTTDKELEEYAKKLAKDEMGPSFSTVGKLKNDLKQIENHCKKYPEDCDKLYISPLTKNSAAGGPRYKDPTGHEKSTFQLPMVDKPDEKISPALKALGSGTPTAWPKK